jgi:hypothetical protein
MEVESEKLDSLDNKVNRVIQAGLQQDAQTSVLMRLTCTSLNTVIERVNRLAELAKLDLPDLEFVTVEKIGSIFHDYGKVAERGVVNRKEMERWFFGEPADSIFPPIPESQQPTRIDDPEVFSDTVFGGDVNETSTPQ